MSTGNNSQQGTQPPNISLFQFYLFMFLLILTGSINTIANKLQNISISLNQSYNHSYFITFLMFLGETLCLILYYIEKKNDQPTTNITTDLQESENLVNNQLNRQTTTISISKPEATPIMLILPALCDFFASTIMTIGLTMLSGSTYQMMRGSSILFVAIFSKIFLRSTLNSFHYIALAIVISGLTLVGAANMIIKPYVPQGCHGGEEEASSLMGYILVIFAQIFVACQFIIEEKFMKNYNCHPLKAIGWEGVWGSSMYFIILVIFQNIHCPTPLPGEKNWSTAVCTRNEYNEYRLEDTLFALRQIAANGSLLFCSIFYTISIAVFNFVGITVTKIASSSARAVIDTVRTVIIWAFFMMPIVGMCHREHFNWIQLIGFIFLIFGTLIYNEILILPFAKRPEEEKLEEEIDNNNRRNTVGSNNAVIAEDRKNA